MPHDQHVPAANVQHQQPQADDSLTNSVPIDQSAINALRIQSMLNCVQGQRDAAINNIVQMQAELDTTVAKLRLEIQVSREFQARNAVLQRELETLRQEHEALKLGTALVEQQLKTVQEERDQLVKDMAAKPAEVEVEGNQVDSPMVEAAAEPAEAEVAQDSKDLHRNPKRNK